MAINFDFSGIATKYDVRCADGLTIRKGAFKHCDGKKVPLVWSHRHDAPKSILGYAILQHRDNDVACYCSLNKSTEGEDARIRVEHGDLDALSVYANHIRKDGSDVVYGDIKEVSLCIAGANPSAHIDHVVLAHGEESETEAVIYSGEYIDERPGELYDMSHEEDSNDSIEHADKNKAEDDDDGDETVQDIIDSMDDEERAILLYFYELGKKEGSKNKSSVKHFDEGGNEMNVFDKKDNNTNNESLMHIDMLRADESKIFDYMRSHNTTFTEAVKNVSLSHADQSYGVKDIEYLFPDYKAVQNTPVWIKRDTTWVDKFLNATRKVPFSRIKSMAADITADEARAKGYTKGKRKLEEVFTLLKRTTESCTVYKKQKIDRQDLIKIKNYNFVGWMDQEMTLMLYEEIARAAIIGDGRLSSSDDKIPEDHIRPIYSDNDLYSIKVPVTTTSSMTASAKAEALIDASIRARKQYKGTGKPTMFTTEDNLTEMLLVKDSIGHRLYKNEEELATTLRVKEVVTVPVMENITRTNNGVAYDLAAIIVNPSDYTIGSDEGGKITSFEQFDIDYNQQKYLKEGDCSGALTIPYSALVLEYTTASSSEPVEG